MCCLELAAIDQRPAPSCLGDEPRATVAGFEHASGGGHEAVTISPMVAPNSPMVRPTSTQVAKARRAAALSEASLKSSIASRQGSDSPKLKLNQSDLNGRSSAHHHVEVGGGQLGRVGADVLLQVLVGHAVGVVGWQRHRRPR